MQITYQAVEDLRKRYEEATGQTITFRQAEEFLRKQAHQRTNPSAERMVAQQAGTGLTIEGANQFMADVPEAREQMMEENVMESPKTPHDPMMAAGHEPVEAVREKGVWEAGVDGSGEAPSIGGFISNAGESADKFGRETIQGLQDISPWNPHKLFEGNLGFRVPPAMEGLAVLGQAAYGSMPGDQGEENEIIAAGVRAEAARYLQDNFSSPEHFARSVYEDPVGWLADLSMVGGAAGSARKVGKAGKFGRALKTVSKLEKLDPTILFGRTLGGAAKLIMQALPDESAMLQRVVKPNRMHDPKNRKSYENYSETALNEGIVFSEGGLAKTEEKIREWKDEVDRIISTKPGEKVPRKAVEDMLNQLERSFDHDGKNRGLAMAAEGKKFIRQLRGQLLGKRKKIDPKTGKPVMRLDPKTGKMVQQLEPQYPKDIDVEALQDFKQEIYEKFESYYKNENMIVGEKKLGTQLAFLLKEDLEAIFPEIKHANKKWGEYINVKEWLEPKLMREASKGGGWTGVRQILSGMGLGAGGFATGAATHSTGAGWLAAGTLASLYGLAHMLSRNDVRSGIAIAIRQGRNAAKKAGLALETSPYAGAFKGLTPIGQVNALRKSVDEQIKELEEQLKNMPGQEPAVPSPGTLDDTMMAPSHGEGPTQTADYRPPAIPIGNPQDAVQTLPGQPTGDPGTQDMVQLLRQGQR